MENNKRTGKIFFSKNPIRNVDYKVEDPWLSTNSFLSKKMIHFDLIELDDRTIDVLENNIKIKISNLDILEEFKFGLSGNRINILDYHKSNILKTINSGKNVWISHNLIPQMKELLSKDFEGIEIVIEDKFSYKDQKEIPLQSIYILLTLFGKFYGKTLSQKENKIFGRIQEKSKISLNKNDILYLKNIIYKVKKSIKISLPQANIFSKIEESLHYIEIKLN